MVLILTFTPSQLYWHKGWSVENEHNKQAAQTGFEPRSIACEAGALTSEPLTPRPWVFFLKKGRIAEKTLNIIPKVPVLAISSPTWLSSDQAKTNARWYQRKYYRILDRTRSIECAFCINVLPRITTSVTKIKHLWVSPSSGWRPPLHVHRLLWRHRAGNHVISLHSARAPHHAHRDTRLGSGSQSPKNKS